MQCADILHPDPYPHTRLALVVVGEEDGTLVSRDAGKSVARTPSQSETKSVHVVGDAGVHVLDSKHRHRGPEAVRCRFRHSASGNENTSGTPVRRSERRWSSDRSDVSGGWPPFSSPSPAKRGPTPRRGFPSSGE